MDSYGHHPRQRSDSFYTQGALFSAPSSESKSQPSSGRPEPSKSRTCVRSQPQPKAPFPLVHEGENDATTISPRFQLPSAGRQDSHRDLNQHPPSLHTTAEVSTPGPSKDMQRT